MPRSSVRRVLVVAVTAAVVLAALPAPVRAAGTAGLAGRVLAADGASPLPGAVVRLVDRASGATFDSAPARADGVFRVEADAPGRYALYVRDGETVYLADGAIALAAGERTDVELTVRPAVALAPAQTAGKGGRSLPKWGKILIGGGVAVTGALLVLDITDSKEVPASPFN